MTTINNLIDQVGEIERAKQLNEMLQKHAVPEEWKISIINGMWHRSSAGFTHKELRTAIAEHDEDHCEHEWNDLTSNGDKYRFLVCKHCDSTQNYLPLNNSRKFKVGDLVVKTHPKNTILWPVLGVYKNGGVWLDYKGFCWKPPRVRHATPAEIKAGHRLEAERHG